MYKCVSVTQRVSDSLSILTAIFPGEPGIAGFIEVKDDGNGAIRCAKLQ